MGVGPSAPFACRSGCATRSKCSPDAADELGFYGRADAVRGVRLAGLRRRSTGGGLTDGCFGEAVFRGDDRGGIENDRLRLGGAGRRQRRRVGRGAEAALRIGRAPVVLVGQRKHHRARQVGDENHPEPGVQALHVVGRLSHEYLGRPSGPVTEEGPRPFMQSQPRSVPGGSGIKSPPSRVGAGPGRVIPSAPPRSCPGPTR